MSASEAVGLGFDSLLLRYFWASPLNFLFRLLGANSQIAPKAVAIEKIYAAGVRGLLLPAVVDKISVLNCQWHFLFDGQFNSFGKTVEVVKGGLCASKVIAGTNETVTCKTTNTSFLSDITLHKRMNFGKLFATFTCDGMNYVNASLNIVCKYTTYALKL